MVKYRRVSFLRPQTVDIAVKATYGDNKKYALQISNLDRSDFKEQRSTINWKKTVINAHAYIVQGVSKTQTAFHEMGELVTMLCFSDGRKIAITPTDLLKKDWMKIAEIMRESYGVLGDRNRAGNNGNGFKLGHRFGGNQYTKDSKKSGSRSGSRSATKRAGAKER